MFLLAAAVAVAGWGMVLQRKGEVLVREATMDGLFVRLDRARWLLDQMEHSQRYPMPSTMMPGMPVHGMQRLSADFTLHNRSQKPRQFQARDFYLLSADGTMWPATGSVVTNLTLAPGQIANMAVAFDFNVETEGDVYLVWLQGRSRVRMPVPHPPAHHQREPIEAVEWPKHVAYLPPGRPDEGARLFNATYGCSACHGLPEAPGSNTVGPDLHRVAVMAASRRQGMPPEQYIYESILEPNAYISPVCKDDLPCAQPSAMPEYAGLLRLQDMADIVAYLMEQRGEG